MNRLSEKIVMSIIETFYPPKILMTNKNNKITKLIYVIVFILGNCWPYSH